MLCKTDNYLVCISFCSLMAVCCLPALPVVSLLTGNRKLPIYILLLCEFIGDVPCEGASTEFIWRYFTPLREVVCRSDIL